MRATVTAGHAAGYLFTNRVHIFLMPVLLTLFCNLGLQLPLPFAYYLMIVCTTAGGYVYNMYTDTAEDIHNYPARYRLFGSDLPFTKVVVAACFFAGFLLALQAGWVFVLYGGAVNLLGTFYSRPMRLRPGGKVFRVKQVPILKNLFAASFWSVALVLTPHVYVGQAPGAAAWTLIAICFGLSIFVELLWDLRDLSGDRLAQVRTIPAVFGERAAYAGLVFIHLATCLGAVAAVWKGILPQPFLVALVHLPIGLAYLHWYRSLADKELASHLYVIYGGILVLIALAWGMATTEVYGVFPRFD